MNTNNALLIIAFTVIIGLGAIIIVKQPDEAKGAAWPGMQSTVATSSFQAVTALTAELLFATSTGCTERVIGTGGGAVKLTFSDYKGQRPTVVNGMPQTASTTVNYPAEVYGCDAVWVFPFTADTLSIAEMVGK